MHVVGSKENKNTVWTLLVAVPIIIIVKCLPVNMIIVFVWLSVSLEQFFMHINRYLFGAPLRPSVCSHFQPFFFVPSFSFVQRICVCVCVLRRLTFICTIYKYESASFILPRVIWILGARLCDDWIMSVMSAGEVSTQHQSNVCWGHANAGTKLCGFIRKTDKAKAVKMTEINEGKWRK